MRIKKKYYNKEREQYWEEMIRRDNDKIETDIEREWQRERMTYRENDKEIEWQRERMTKRENDKEREWHIERMTKRKNDKEREWQRENDI